MDLLPDRIDADAPIFVISVAAQLAEMHPQTLRGYDRLGLVVPGRARGRGRRYSLRDIAKLRHIQHLSQNEGINLEGIRRILALESELDGLRGQLTRLAQVVHGTAARSPRGCGCSPPRPAAPSTSDGRHVTAAARPRARLRHPEV